MQPQILYINYTSKLTNAVQWKLLFCVKLRLSTFLLKNFMMMMMMMLKVCSDDNKMEYYFYYYCSISLL